jgi:hypothetical protein
LVKMVLSAMPTFFLTIFKMPKCGLSKIDRFQRSFLWRGQDPDNVKGGHCLVNWQVCTRPKKLGGLGIKDLEKFSKALRLRWLWYNWDQVDMPWKHLLRVSDHTDRQLFFSSTIISLGNGQDTPFWEAKWLNGMAPKELAPNLFEVARYKKRSVKTEMQGANWIRNLTDVTTSAQLEEFTLLFMAISSVQLSDQKDKIVWKWTSDGQYTVASAYDCQFYGTFSYFPALPIWKAITEPKCNFFAWLVL